MNNDEGKYSIEELAAALSLSPRTIRYYQTEGYLPRPEIENRRAVYSTEHLERLRRIVEGKTEKSLSEIASDFDNEDMIESAVDSPPTPQRIEQVFRFLVRTGVEVLVSPAEAGLDSDGIQRLFSRMAVAANTPGEDVFRFIEATPRGSAELLDELERMGLDDDAFGHIHPKGNETIRRHREYVSLRTTFRTDSDNVGINHRLQYCLYLARKMQTEGTAVNWRALTAHVARTVPLRKLGK